MPSPPVDVLQGTLEVMVLRALTVESTHGYGVARWIRERTGGALDVQDAALYQALRRLERKGWVEAEWAITENNRRARFYRLTATGQRELAREASALRRFVHALVQVLDAAPGEAR